MVVGIRPVHHPPPLSGSASRGEAETAVVLRQIGVLQANEVELGARRKDGRRGFALGDAGSVSLGERDRHEQANRRQNRRGTSRDTIHRSPSEWHRRNRIWKCDQAWAAASTSGKKRNTVSRRLT